MVRREAVRAVDRDRDPDADLVKRQRIEDGFGEHDLFARPRRLEVHDAAKRAGKVAVPWRLQAAAVEARPLPGQRIRDRHHDAAAEKLAPFGRDDTERQELLPQLALLRDHLQERPVRVADLERLDEVRVRDPTFDEVGLRVLPLAESPVVVLDDAGEDLAGVRQRRRAMEGRALGRGLRSQLAIPRRRQRRERRSLLDSRPVLHQLREIEACPPCQRLERSTKAHLVVLREEADDVTRGAAAEAVVKPLRRRDVEGRRLLLVERAGADELLAFLLELDPALSDERLDRVRCPDTLDAFLADLHPSSSPLHEARRRPCPSGAGLPTSEAAGPREPARGGSRAPPRRPRGRRS